MAKEKRRNPNTSLKTLYFIINSSKLLGIAFLNQPIFLFQTNDSIH
mgnify:CR=1 FL=1